MIDNVYLLKLLGKKMEKYGEYERMGRTKAEGEWAISSVMYGPVRKVPWWKRVWRALERHWKPVGRDMFHGREGI